MPKNATVKDGIATVGDKYYAVVRVRDAQTGKSKPRWSRPFANYDEAKAQRDKDRVAAREGSYVARSGMTVGEYLDMWVESVDVKPSTRSGYRDNIRLYLTPHIGGLPLQTLTAARLTELYANLMTSGGRGGKALSWRSVEYAAATLRSALSDAVELEALTKNVAMRAKLPTKPTPATRAERRAQEMTVFDPEQLRAFLQVARGHRLSALFHLAAYSGARRGELLQLRWNDINLDDATVHIFGTYDVIDGEEVEGTPKSHAERTIDIDPGTVAVLRAHKRDQDGPRFIGEAEEGGLVFAREDGTLLHPDTPTQLMRRLCREAGVPRLRFHDLRHTHATILLTAGVPVHEVAERLGHYDGTVTLRVYAKVLKGRGSVAAAAFAAAMGGLDRSPC